MSKRTIVTFIVFVLMVQGYKSTTAQDADTTYVSCASPSLALTLGSEWQIQERYVSGHNLARVRIPLVKTSLDLTLDLALEITLYEVESLPKPDFLILDEATDEYVRFVEGLFASFSETKSIVSTDALMSEYHPIEINGREAAIHYYYGDTMFTQSSLITGVMVGVFYEESDVFIHVRTRSNTTFEELELVAYEIANNLAVTPTAPNPTTQQIFEDNCRVIVAVADTYLAKAGSSAISLYSNEALFNQRVPTPSASELRVQFIMPSHLPQLPAYADLADLSPEDALELFADGEGVRIIGTMRTVENDNHIAYLADFQTRNSEGVLGIFTDGVDYMLFSAKTGVGGFVNFADEVQAIIDSVQFRAIAPE